MPTAQDLRDALARLKESGKVVALINKSGEECYVAREAIVGFTELGTPIWVDRHGNLQVGAPEED